MILVILIWIIATLLMAGIAILLGKRFGVHYPIAIMASLVVVANILAVKLVTFGPFIVPAGVLVFSVTFLITDLISEIWGKRYAQYAVWSGLIASIFMALSALIAISWPIAPFMEDFQQSFEAVLGFTPRLVIASIIAYLISQHHDVWSFHWWRKRTKGRHLWLRNNASTLVSQALDSTLFATIAFWGVAPILPIIIGNYVVKALIALIDTPFMYGILAVAGRLKKH